MRPYINPLLMAIGVDDLAMEIDVEELLALGGILELVGLLLHDGVGEAQQIGAGRIIHRREHLIAGEQHT